MKFSHSRAMPALRDAAIVLVAGAALAAVAQVRTPTDSNSPPDHPGKVVSDARPLPAEDRDSHGAIMLREQPVRAQSAAAAAGERTGVTGAVSGRVTRLLEKARSWNDVREADANRNDPTRTMGGPQ